MKDVAIIGAGKIGSTIAEYLASASDFRVTLLDCLPERLYHFRQSKRIYTIAQDIHGGGNLVDLLRAKFAVVNAAPFELAIRIAEAARAAGCHYLDLTEDLAMTRAVRECGVGARTAFFPQCGLAPGFVSVLAFEMIKGFDRLDSVELRVGAIPQYPANSLKYNLTWSTEGVINEYCEPCEAIVNGVRRQVQPLEETEEFWLDGVAYEAFNTSGGLGTLCDTLDGKVRTLNYRTIRYPGHAVIMRTLLNDLRLRERRDLLKDILEYSVPTTLQDVVVVCIRVVGLKNGLIVQETYANKIYSRDVDGRRLSAIQITTAGAVCAVLDLLAAGKLPQSGVIRQEDVPLPIFLGNRFGQVFAESPLRSMVSRWGKPEQHNSAGRDYADTLVAQ